MRWYSYYQQFRGLFYFMTYGEKLKDPRWQKKRLEIMERDEWICKYCQCKNQTLHVHHKSYEYGSDPWDYVDSNFITLCEICHQKEEVEKIYFNTTVKYLLKNGFNYYHLTGLLADTYIKTYNANEQKENDNG
jgi:5-methylcytosine-specific restriction endonuclease McrA